MGLRGSNSTRSSWVQICVSPTSLTYKVDSSFTSFKQVITQLLFSPIASSDLNTYLSKTGPSKSPGANLEKSPGSIKWKMERHML